MGGKGRLHRVLCLHGAGTNPDMMEIQCGKLQYALKDLLKCEFVAATEIDPAPAADIIDIVDAPYYLWWQDGSGQAGRDVAVQHLLQHIDTNGPYDAILGFSQGAAVASLLSAALETRSNVSADELKDGVQLPRLIVCVCGVLPNTLEGGEAELGIESVKVSIPSIHVIGLEDMYRAHSEALARECYEAAVERTPSEDAPTSVSTVLYHDRGHVFPENVEGLATLFRRHLEPFQPYKRSKPRARIAQQPDTTQYQPAQQVPAIPIKLKAGLGASASTAQAPSVVRSTCGCFVF